MWNRYWWFSNFFEVLCTVILSPKPHFFQNMHRLVTPKSKTSCGHDFVHFGKIRGSKNQRCSKFSDHIFFCEMRTFRISINSSLRMLTLHCIFLKINSTSFSQLLRFNLTQYTSFSHNYVWRKSERLLTTKVAQNLTEFVLKKFSILGSPVYACFEKSVILVKVSLYRGPQKSSEITISIPHCWEAFLI